MKISKKLIICVAAIVAMAWIYNIVRYEVYSLKEPIFIKEYVEHRVYKENQEEHEEDKESVAHTSYQARPLEIYYVDNYANENTNYITVSFPEINSQSTFSVMPYVNEMGGNTFWQGYNFSNTVEFYPYKLNVLTIDLSQIYLVDGRSFFEALEDEGEITITKIQVDNGDNSKEKDIGKITISIQGILEEGLELVQETIGYNDIEWNNANYKALRDIEISSIDSKYMSEFERIGNIKIDDVDIKDIKFPIKIKEGNEFKVSHRLRYEDIGAVEELYIVNATVNINVIDSKQNSEILKVSVGNWYNDIVYFMDEYGDLNKLFKDK